MENQPRSAGSTTKKRIPAQEGLFRMPGEPQDEPQLFGSRCKTCGEVFFPRQEMCANCCTPSTEEVVLSKTGMLYSYTAVRHQPPGDYRGPLPFSVGTVELPEGLRITGPLTEPDLAKLKVGMKVELVIDTLFGDSEGNELVGFKFKPVSG